MKIIILGHNSFTGVALNKFFSKFPSNEIYLIGRKPIVQDNFFLFEISNDHDKNETNLLNIFDEIEVDDNSVIINLISEGNVDNCEKNPDMSIFLNIDFVKSIYRTLKKFKFYKFIHFSTNAVYQGNNPPYSESSNTIPVNKYGEHKVKIDKFLLSKEDKRLIVVRPTTMYGDITQGGRQNPVGMIISSLSNKKSIKLVNDLVVNILFVEDLCEVLKKLLELDFNGLINIGGKRSYSRFELGLDVASILKLDQSLIQECSMSDFPSYSQRPLDTSFDISLQKKLTNMEPKSIEYVLKNYDYKTFYEKK